MYQYNCEVKKITLHGQIGVNLKKGTEITKAEKVAKIAIMKLSIITQVYVMDVAKLLELALYH